MSDLAAFHAIAQGRVQGVNYRAFVSRNAAALGLTGYCPQPAGQFGGNYRRRR